jgi:cephalosporin-C deacetylase-like acetyl esterase
MSLKNRYYLIFQLILITVCSFALYCTDRGTQRIRPSTSIPATTPWDLNNLSHPPEFEWAGGEGDRIRSLYYQSEPYQGKQTRVFAYYATPGTISGQPEKDNHLPAMVLVHGGGGRAFSEWVKLWASRGYAAIAMDLAGCGPDKEPLQDGGPGQGHDMKFRTIDLPVTEQWTYHAIANVIRAHSLVLSFPEIDPDRTALTGISWGGFLTCIVAGLDNRFKAAVPVYGCGFIYANSVNSWMQEFENMSDANRQKWITLWDPSQYVGSASMPMLFVNGGTDFAYYPDSYAKTYALVKSPKNIRYTPSLKHGHIFDRPRAIEVFIDSHIKQGTPLANITELDMDNDMVKATVDAPTKLITATMHYTLDSLNIDNKTRTWHSIPATVKDNTIFAKPPPEDTMIWFLTVTDERQTQVSSWLVFPKQEMLSKYKRKNHTIQYALNNV